MSRISGLRNDMNKRTFYKERKINKRCIHFSCKQNIKAPLILDMYGIEMFNHSMNLKFPGACNQNVFLSHFSALSWQTCLLPDADLGMIF